MYKETQSVNISSKVNILSCDDKETYRKFLDQSVYLLQHLMVT